ncbi:hypothetical protein Halru_0047 [Halovivax ruber XH-70]|uniref:Uncharacterized protein n=1 Tax=Halovivax ruber (strain DSM 18193 / JCM 13892 / XH-70) TaxID=797302 RepID=L0I8Y0_HALRX|nr:hypothetical protein [Halovivax ruber]AGB14701.1 hypothetical protein Halru_0047 [Halovivax ruber XH-70]
MSELDFLKVKDLTFSSEEDFINYVDSEVDFGEVEGNVNIIGSVSDYITKEQFTKALEYEFETIWSTGDLYLSAAHTNSSAIPYYVYFDEDFPVFITTANITDEMPPTIERFLRTDPNLGRFWLSMEQMELLRAEISRKYADMIVPFFTGNRSEYTEIPAEKRDEIDRTITYWGDDGRQAYKEMRTKYGVLPTNIVFDRPNHFKFGIKQEGVFKHQDGSIKEAWELYRSERTRKKRVKKAINTGQFNEQTESTQIAERTISGSKPWAVEMDKAMTSEPLESFVPHLNEEELEFSVANYKVKPDRSSFDAQLVDNNSYGSTRLRGRRNAIRVYPHEGSGIDQHIRIYNFVQDHFDPSCRAVEV